MNKPNLKAKLPELPSELIELALKDLEKCEANPEFKINMSEWVTNKNAICNVCFAGAVMAQEFKLHHHENYLNNDYICGTISDGLSIEASQAFDALDSFRIGFIKRGCDQLRLIHPFTNEDEIDVTHYADDPVQFKQDMQLVIAKLKSKGF